MPDTDAKPRRQRQPRNEGRRPASPQGRTHELDRVITVRDGRNVTVEEACIERVATGIPIVQAAGGLGVRMQTIHDWRRRGARARSRQIAGETITDPDELRYIAFADRIDEAEARAFSTEWTRHGTVAAGGLERVTVTERQALDREGKVVTLVDRKREVLPPDVKAIQYRLAVRWGLSPRTQVELTGADGGPVEVDVLDARAAALADRLRRMTEATDAEAVEVVAVPDLASGGPDRRVLAGLGGGSASTPQGPPLVAAGEGAFTTPPVSSPAVQARRSRALVPSPDADVPPPPD